jgi:hypothetical protein
MTSSLVFFNDTPPFFSLSDRLSYGLNGEWKKIDTLHNNFFEKITNFTSKF